MECIKNLLALHTRFSRVVKKQFKNHKLCKRALDGGFNEFINRKTYVAKCLATYSHNVLKRGRKPNDAPINETLDSIVKIYGYIQDKDFFELQYQNLFADRLINNLSNSWEDEKVMLGKLNVEGQNSTWCGKVKNMFKDFETSQVFMREFDEKKHDDQDIAFSCIVCTYGNWGLQPAITFPMPEQAAKITSIFKLYYEDKFNGRTLEYRMDQGKAEIDLRFRGTEEVKTFVVSPHQMAILLKFNEKAVWEHSKLQAETEISEKKCEFQNALTSLAHPRFKILLKTPNCRECNPEDLYQINEKFKHVRRRIVVPTFSQIHKKRNEENARMRQNIIKRRTYMVDAAVVRTMKIRKQMNHRDLMTDVIQQLQHRFQVQPAMLKRRIATLIDQEYMQRDPDPKKRNTYHYMA